MYIYFQRHIKNLTHGYTCATIINPSQQVQQPPTAELHQNTESWPQYSHVSAFHSFSSRTPPPSSSPPCIWERCSCRTHSGTCSSHAPCGLVWEKCSWYWVEGRRWRLLEYILHTYLDHISETFNIYLHLNCIFLTLSSQIDWDQIHKKVDIHLFNLSMK